MSEARVDVFGGVDTHRDTHVAAVVDTAGRVLATAPFRADTTGYEQLSNWLGSHGQVVRVGIEGTGSYGAGLTRYLNSVGVEVVEVEPCESSAPSSLWQDRCHRRPGRGSGCSERAGQRVAQKR